jgi:hypothetical protein
MDKQTEATRSLEWPVVISGNWADYGITVQQPTGAGWYVTFINHLVGDVNNGNHVAYVSTYNFTDWPNSLPGDELQVPTANIPIIAWCSGEELPDPLPESYSILRTWEDKPIHERGCNFPLYANQVCRIAVYDANSAIISGITTAHPDEEEGNTWGHHSFSIGFTNYGSYVPPQTTETLETFIRRKSWDEIGVNYNQTAALTKYATEHGMGKPETNEFDLTHEGTTYRVQAFVAGIVYCVVGDWGNIRALTW